MSEIDEKRHPLKSLFVGVTAILSTLYLLNPGFGIGEFIPDNFPIFGNLDEAAIAAILVSCLSYFGLDITKIFAGKPKSNGEKPVKGSVVDN